ncbi:MAG: YidC/Oxa1 family membrane protein insertase, partial [Acutalibacteraceae bacterium]
MDALTGWIALPLGFIMQWCYRFIQNYGLAIILFTLITKIIILPLSVWVQKNSIKMVKMQPELNRVKAKFFGDADTIADEESKLYKKNRYNPLASLVPLIIQIVLLMGVVGVIYHPFDYLFHLPAELITAINSVASQITGVGVGESSIQLTAVECIKNPEYYNQFAALSSQFANFDVQAILSEIKNFDLMFLGINLSHNPSVVLGVTIAVPVVAGLSSYLLCVAQNKSNVLQA